jgi:hypothetical protein
MRRSQNRTGTPEEEIEEEEKEPEYDEDPREGARRGGEGERCVKVGER